MDILFLCTELAGYNVNCLNFYSQKYQSNKLHVIRWPTNLEAPFKFNFNSNIKVFLKSDLNINTYIVSNNVKVIICCGWMDKTYLKSIKKNRHIQSILMFDNFWRNSIKQNLGRIVIPLTIKRLFNKCWLPGEIQKEYAVKLGFKEEQIFLGFYATDLDGLNKAYLKNRDKKEKNYPKSFLYVGRYLTIKGIEDLWSAFLKFNETNKEWILNCVGNGELFKNKIKHKNIIHHDFIQPEYLPKLVSKSGVFIMPSHFDHWGMAVQEFAAAGLPIICSTEVGSATEFLKEGENGYSFEAKNIESLCKTLHKIANNDTNKLIKFGNKSNELSSKYNVKTWSDTLNKIIEGVD